MKKSKKELDREEARELRHNKGLTIEELAAHYGKSERTIYRWLSNARQKNQSFNTILKRNASALENIPLKYFPRLKRSKKNYLRGAHQS